MGSALSGGIDSSSIVAGVRALGGSAIDLQAVGYVADDPQISEERWIDLAADAAGARVHKVSISPDELRQDLKGLIRAQDEPFGSASIYAQYRVFQTAADRGLKVMLDGQGADEIFAGYMSLLPYRWAGHVRAGALWRAVRFMRSVAPHSGVSARSFLVRGLGALAPSSLHPFLVHLTGSQAVPQWMDGTWLERRGVDTTVNPARLGHRRDLRSVSGCRLARSESAATPPLRGPQLHGTFRRESRPLPHAAPGRLRASAAGGVPDRRPRPDQDRSSGVRCVASRPISFSTAETRSASSRRKGNGSPPSPPGCARRSRPRRPTACPACGATR